jgi:6-phospho-3-hexuloisomerase
MKASEYASRIAQEIVKALKGISDREAALLLDRIQKAERIFFAGAGRSGLMVRAFAMRLMQMGLTCFVAGETVTPAIRKGDLLLIGSGSGETRGLLNMALKARETGADVALVTAVRGSSIGQQAHMSVIIPTASPKPTLGYPVSTVQPRGSLFEQGLLIFFETLVVMLMERMNFKPEDIFKRHANLE